MYRHKIFRASRANLVLECAIIALKKNMEKLKLNGLNQVPLLVRGLDAPFDNTHTHTLYIFTPSVFIKVSAFAHTRSGPLEKHSNNAVGLSTRADIFYCSSSVSACLELDSFFRCFSTSERMEEDSNVFLPVSVYFD